jgi:hypothetical protein
MSGTYSMHAKEVDCIQDFGKKPEEKGPLGGTK